MGKKKGRGENKAPPGSSQASSSAPQQGATQIPPQQPQGTEFQQAPLGRGRAFARGRGRGHDQNISPGQQPSLSQAETSRPGQNPNRQRNEGSVSSIEQEFPTLSVSKKETPSPRAPTSSTQPLQQPVQQQDKKSTFVKQEPKGDPLPATQFTLRKTQGTKGRPTRVDTNHMAVSINNKKDIYHYDVAFVPDKPKRLLRPAMFEFIKKTCQGRCPAFDGRKNLYSSELLPFGRQHKWEGPVNNVERGTVEQFEITVKVVSKLDFSAISNYLNSDRKSPIPQDVLQAIDVVMRNFAASRMIQVGRSFFSPPKGRVCELGNGMELWVGTFQSTTLGWKPFINVDVAHKGFPKEQSVVDLIIELTREKHLQELQPRHLDDLQRFIKGMKVEYEIPGQANTKRVYKVNGVVKKPSELTFNTEDDGSGQTITVEKYFQDSRNYKLRHPHLPCLHVGSLQRQIYVPVELCVVMKGQVSIKKLDDEQTRNMIREAATPAQVRKRKIMEAFSNLGLNKDPCMREFGITVSEKMEQVDARVLDAPQLEYKSNQVKQPARGEWRLSKEQFLKCGTLNKWAIICLDKYVRDDDLGKFEQLITQNGKGLGMTVAPCTSKSKVNIQRDNRELIQKLESLKGYNLVFVVVPDRGDAYSKVKQYAELKYGILTQCIKAFTMTKRMNPATACNILLKVNAKLDGINHALHPTSRPMCLSKPVMLMGADVTHPSPDAINIPSIAAVTASHDPKAFQYNIEWRLQPPKMEIIEDLEQIVVKQLRFFYKKTNCQPDRIIFYRDGVSDGQFAEVLTKELSAIRRGCASLNKNYKPMITFLVVQKRHHTRFFPTNPKDEDGKNKNVPPGLVVDRTITHPRDMDFYLVSHASIQGTSRPTKYHMLHDDANMSEDEVEQLTYYLCHLFSRCNRSVSYPAPTYYAHLAAFRAKAYIEGSRIDINNLKNEQARRVITKEIVEGSPMFFV